MAGRREQSIFDVPGARSVSTAYNAAYSWSWQYNVQPGKMLQGLYVDAIITTAGAGMATTTMANVLQKFTVINEANTNTLDVDKYTIDLASAVTCAYAWSNGYNAIPRTTDVCRDPANVATGGTFYANWRIHCPLPGQKHLISIVTPGILATWSGATGGSISMSVTAIWADTVTDGVNRKQYTLYAKQTTTVTRLRLRGGEIVGVSTTAEWTTLDNGITIGSTMSPEQILRYEAVANDALRGFLVDGTSTATNTKVLKDPFTAADQFMLARQMDDANVDAVINVNTSSSFKAIVMGQRDVTEVPVIG